MTEKQTFKNNRRPDLTSGELDPGSLSLLSWGDETLQCRDFSLPLLSQVPPVQHMMRNNKHMKIPLQLNTMYRWPPWWPPCQTSSFWTPLIHSLRHTELLNCVKLYSMYKVVTYINSTILVFTHGARMGQQKSSLFSVLRLQETQNRLQVQHPDDNHRAEMTFTCFILFLYWKYIKK